MKMATMTDQECRQALSDLLSSIGEYADKKYEGDYMAEHRFFEEDLGYRYPDYPEQ